MRDIRNLKSRSLRWFKLGWFRGWYDLLGGDGETYASLEWKGVLTDKAVAHTAYGDFELSWRGFIRRSVPILDTASRSEIGRLRLGIRDSGTLDLDSGRKYKFRSLSILGSKWEFADELGSRVFHLAYIGVLKLRRSGSEIVLGPASEPGRDLLLMMIVGWYAAVMITQEQYAAVAASG